MESGAKPVIAYIRVSTEQQAREGVSLEDQERQIRAWAEARGHPVGGVFIDAGVSGKDTTNRPELNEAMNAVTRARGVLVCYSLSRLSRSTTDTIALSDRLERGGADLVSLSESIDTTNAAGKMVFKMLAVMAEFERDLVAERTAGAMAAKRAKGEFTGGTVPFGFALADDGVQLVEEQVEQETIQDILALRGKGLSYRAVAAELSARGVFTRAGRPWSAKVLRSICLRGTA